MNVNIIYFNFTKKSRKREGFIKKNVCNYLNKQASHSLHRIPPYYTYSFIFTVVSRAYYLCCIRADKKNKKCIVCR